MGCVSAKRSRFARRIAFLTITLNCLASSAALLEELADVLMRPLPAKRLAAICKAAQAMLADYVEVVEVAAPAEVPRGAQ